MFDVSQGSLQVQQSRAHPILIAAGAAVLLFSLLGMAAVAGVFV